MTEKRYTISSVGPRILEFLTKILKHARLRVTPEVREPEPRYADFENPEIAVNFTGPDVEILLANKAEVLLALEHLTMEMLRMPQQDHSLVAFDANEYRVLRIEELRLSAMAAAERVKSTRKPFRFNPMSSRERRIIHLALRNETAVWSGSSGEGSHRGVVVYPAGMEAAEEETPAPAPQRLRRRRR